MKQLLFISFVLISLSSCSRKVYFQDAIPTDDEAHFYEDTDVTINTFYAGDAIDYIIFEINIENNSDEAIFLDNDDVVLTLVADDSIYFPSLSRTILIDDIHEYQQQLRRQRRARNVEAAVNVGLNILNAVIIRDPAATLDAIVYSTDAAIYAFEGNRASALINGSLEERIAYVNDSVLDYTKIKPGEEQNWDVLFEPTMMDGVCKLQLECMGKTFDFEYELFINEFKN